MSKKKKTEEVTEVETTNNEVSISFDNSAFSIVPEGKKKYSIVKVTFDAKTNLPGLVSVVESGLDLHQAKDSFKRNVINAGLFDAK